MLAKSRRLDELVEAWRGWHAIAAPMKAKYARYVELANEGARDIGFADVGALWRVGLRHAARRLRGRRRAALERREAALRRAPLLRARASCRRSTARTQVPDHAPIPAELLGNMWAQEWNNIYDLVVPYPQRAVARRRQEARRGALGREEDGQPGRALLHVARLRPAARRRSGSARSSRARATARSSATRARGT